MRRFALLALVLALPLFTDEPKERFNCNLVRMDGPAATRTSFFSVLIEDYTSDDEAKEVRELLKAKGASAVRMKLFDKEIGAVFTTGSLATPLCFIRQFPLENGKGRRIVGIASRRTSFGETWRSSRSLDYLWSMVEFTVDENGRGGGLFYELATFEYDEKGKLVITSGTRQPTKMLNIKLAKKK